MLTINYCYVFLLLIVVHADSIASGKFHPVYKSVDVIDSSPKLSRRVLSSQSVTLPPIKAVQYVSENNVYTPRSYVKKSEQTTPSDVTSEGSLDSNLVMDSSFDSRDTPKKSVVSYKSSQTKEFFNGLVRNDLVQGSRTVLDQGFVQLEPFNSLAENALHDAARNDAYQMINFLVKKERLNIDQKNLKGETPLCVGAQSRHYKAVEALVDAGADLNAQDNLGRTALHWACDDGTGILSTNKIRVKDGDRIVKFLITVDRSIPAENKSKKIISFDDQDPSTYTNVDMQDHEGRVPLHLAVLSKRYGALRELADWGAVLDMPDHKGQTPLHLAVIQGDARAVAILLDAGADARAVDSQSNKPVHYATNLEVIKILKKHEQLR